MSLEPGALGFALETLQQGHAPFWDPRLSCGSPLFAALGQGLAYPGILLRLMLPGSAGWLLYAFFHAALAFAAARSLRWPHPESEKDHRSLGDLGSLIVALSVGLLALFFEAAWSAALTWALVIESQSDQDRFLGFRAALWTLALSCGAWLLTLPHALWLLFRSRRSAFALNFGEGKALLLGLLWSAPAWLPSLVMLARAENLWLGLLPRTLHRSGETDANMASRLHGARLGASDSLRPAQRRAWASQPGLSLSFGSPWATREQAELERQSAGQGPGHDYALSMLGVAWQASEPGPGAAWRSPVSAAIVSDAAPENFARSAGELAQPFYSRALRVASTGQGAMSPARWQLLPPPSIKGDGFSLRFEPAAQGAWAFASVTHDPGWSYWDGKRWLGAWRAESAFLAARLEAGQSELRFRYQAPLWSLALSLGVLGLVLAHFSGLPAWLLRGQSKARLR